MRNAGNQYLWQPRKTGPVYIRFSFYLPGEDTPRRYVRSLGTLSWSDARRIRDRAFLPLITILPALRSKRFVHC